MRNYCTYFDWNYLSRGLALIQSLRRHAEPFRLWVLCLDPQTQAALRHEAFSNVECLSLEQLESHDPELLAIKAERSPVEYFFTLTPCLPLFIFDLFPEIEDITYLDADIFFFNSPDLLYREVSDASVGIVPHRFPPRLKRFEKNGLFNVAWNYFRRNAAGLECLRWWRARCLEWCYDRHEPGKFADQKYLDDWPTRFDGVKVVELPGANLAPWNCGEGTIRLRHGMLFINDEPVIFFHFHGLREVAPLTFDLNLRSYGVAPSHELIHNVFDPYIASLCTCPRRSATLRKRGRKDIRGQIGNTVGAIADQVNLRVGKYYKFSPPCPCNTQS